MDEYTLMSPGISTKDSEDGAVSVVHADFGDLTPHTNSSGSNVQSHSVGGRLIMTATSVNAQLIELDDWEYDKVQEIDYDEAMAFNQVVEKLYNMEFVGELPDIGREVERPREVLTMTKSETRRSKENLGWCHQKLITLPIFYFDLFLN